MDKAGPERYLPEHDGTTERVAEGRPEGVCSQTYGDTALRLRDMGFEPLPIMPGGKRPAVNAWTSVRIDEAQVEAWGQHWGSCGIGLRTGHLVAVDIDILDPDLAHQAAAITRQRLGDTLVRVGRWPKRLMLYRTLTPLPKRRVGKVEVLGQGQQFVAFGIHPDTGRPYDWPGGDSPLDWRMDALPLVDEAAIEALLAELEPLAEPPPSGSRRGHFDLGLDARPQAAATRNGSGLVVDGRDGWLSSIAFHAVHDAMERGEPLDDDRIATNVWARFCETTDLGRTGKDGRHPYGPGDAERKVRDKLALHRRGELPDRRDPTTAPAYTLPILSAKDARKELDAQLARFCACVLDLHGGGETLAAPRLGIRATVGLGKSTAARRHIADLIGALASKGLPYRVMNFVPSLGLADETADAWAELGVGVAVLRGYEARERGSRRPMCLDLVAVRAAAAAGFDIQSSVCYQSRTKLCPHFATCPKQANRREVEKADVVVAAYDALFTGFAGGSADVALVVVDEACWPRSLGETSGLTIEALSQVGLAGIAPSRSQDRDGSTLADLVASRQGLAIALGQLPTGDVHADALKSSGNDAHQCEAAELAEIAALPERMLFPGQGPQARRAALDLSTRRAVGLKVIALWRGLKTLLSGDEAGVAKIWLGDRDSKSGQRPIVLWHRKLVSGEFVGLPLLHLDATLRADMAQTILPGLEVVVIEAKAPYQLVRHISGRFGMGSLVPSSRNSPEDEQRRANRLSECVDYVRWHARRHAPGRCLVITYKAIEEAFAGIEGVAVAHYNAVAGLDGWRNIACLFLIGRPLPASPQLHQMTGALLDRSVAGRYMSTDVGVLTRTGRATSLRTVRHSDPSAELLRAAICDDEVIQALGRGRGINRTEDNPLEVHLMADVALPLAYDRVLAWDNVRPDIVQRMLLAGLAVDSPADAAMTHPGLFGSVSQAEKVFQRAAFGGQNPIRDIYREMSAKSATYRRPGRGRGWQRAWWIDGSEAEARALLEAAVGPLAEWQPG